MASFATASDLNTYTGTTVATARAEQLLDLASGVIRAYTGQYIERVLNDTIVVPGNHTYLLSLPERPVLAVDSVTVGDTALTVDNDYVWDGFGNLYRGASVTGVLVVNGPGTLLSDRGDWGGPGTQVTVQYDHGFATIPSDVKAVCLQMAARALSSPDGVNSETVGSYSVSYARSSGVMLTPDEQNILDRYRQKVHA